MEKYLEWLNVVFGLIPLVLILVASFNVFESAQLLFGKDMIYMSIGLLTFIGIFFGFVSDRKSNISQIYYAFLGNKEKNIKNKLHPNISSKELEVIQDDLRGLKQLRNFISPEIWLYSSIFFLLLTILLNLGASVPAKIGGTIAFFTALLTIFYLILTIMTLNIFQIRHSESQDILKD